MLRGKDSPEILRLDSIYKWVEARVQRAMLAKDRERVERLTEFQLKVYFKAQEMAKVSSYSDFN